MMNPSNHRDSKVTVPIIRGYKAQKRRFTALTAYDYLMAQILDEAGIDIILIGDSLGTVVCGRPNTLSVTMEEIIYHTRAVVRGASRALIVADMPFLSYQVSGERAIENCGMALKEGGAEAVKLEGGQNICPLVRELTGYGIPVMGHIGLTPQSIHSLGGYRVQGREEDRRKEVIDDALSLQDAGVFSIVLETIPMGLAKEITESLEIPTIGIGAGVHCDGQILVVYDMLGLFEDYSPRFVKRYADIRGVIAEAITEYIKEVHEGSFPGEEHSFK